MVLPQPFHSPVAGLQDTAHHEVLAMKHTLQSAMEYLMTYGWAILIIAVVLGALFQLGIFNASTFTPKSPPGACHVFRPNGPGTTSFINLQGICNGELPQYVAKFNGVSNYVDLNTVASDWYPQSTYSLSAWIELSSNARGSILGNLKNGGGGYQVWISGSGAGYTAYGTDQIASSTATFSTSTWYNLVITSSGSVFGIYVNGIPQTVSYTSWSSISPYANYISTKIGYSWVHYFAGQIANVQIYNSSLTSNEITALYNEGIGGAPVKLNNLVGWWPLNGDAKDYSGNNANGAASGISFTSSWEAGYSAP